LQATALSCEDAWCKNGTIGRMLRRKIFRNNLQARAVRDASDAHRD
jgi:hypothetical protein